MVKGAPYFISDYEGRTLAATGKVCKGITKYECYQTMADGTYILRLGAGSFGRVTGFPFNGSYWQGCGEEGGLHDQLVSFHLTCLSPRMRNHFVFLFTRSR